MHFGEVDPSTGDIVSATTANTIHVLHKECAVMDIEIDEHGIKIRGGETMKTESGTFGPQLTIEPEFSNSITVRLAPRCQ